MKLMELDKEREALEEKLLGIYEQLDSDEREYAEKYSDG